MYKVITYTNTIEQLSEKPAIWQWATIQQLGMILKVETIRHTGGKTYKVEAISQSEEIGLGQRYFFFMNANDVATITPTIN